MLVRSLENDDVDGLDSGHGLGSGYVLNEEGVCVSDWISVETFLKNTGFSMGST